MRKTRDTNIYTPWRKDRTEKQAAVLKIVKFITGQGYKDYQDYLTWVRETSKKLRLV